MIEGYVDDERTPLIPLMVGHQQLMAVVDTGFNGGLDLPKKLKADVTATFVGEFEAELAGGRVVKEDVFEVMIQFDGQERLVRAAFSDASEVLIGTELLVSHRVEIDFPSQTVRLTRP